MSRTLVGLIRASHPEPGAAVTVAATLLAVGAGHHLAGALRVAVVVLATQLAVGWVNDWLDAGRDTLTGRADKPLATGAVSRRAVGTAGLVAALTTPVLAMSCGVPAAICITVALLSALLYDWPLKFTAASVLPYVVSFALLPAFVVLALPGSPAPPAWLLAAGGLLGGGAHFANVLPDLADDARTGVRGLPHRIGAVPSAVAGAVLLGGATLLLVLGPAGPPDGPGRLAVVLAVPAVVLAALAGSARRRRLAFPAVLLLTLLDVVLLVLGGGSLG